MKIHKSVLKRNIKALHLNMSVSAKFFFLQFESAESNAVIALCFTGRHKSELSFERVARCN